MIDGVGFEDRYRAVGLRGNPFAAVDHGGPEGLATLEDELLIDRGIPDLPVAPNAPTLVQLVGDSGRGKTTQLLRWRRRRPGPYHYIVRAPYRERWLRPPTAPPRHGNGAVTPVYGDEIDRMPGPRRRRWFTHLARAEALVAVGTHDDLTDTAARAGFDITTHHLPHLDRPLLRTLVDRRLTAAAMGERAVEVGFDDDQIDEVVANSEGSIRLAEEYCHHVLARLVR